MTVLLTVYHGVTPKSSDPHDVHTECISIQTHREAQSPTISEDVWNFVIRCSLCQSKHKTFDVLIPRLRIVFLELILFLHRQGALMSSHYCSLFPAYMIASTILTHQHSSLMPGYLISVWFA